MQLLILFLLTYGNPTTTKYSIGPEGAYANIGRG